MRNFCNNILKFSIIILLFNGTLFLFTNGEYYKEYKKYPDKIFNKFILSDSHGLPMRTFPEKYNVFNLSAGSDSYLDMERKISYLLINKYKVDTIFITVDDHTLSPYRERTNNLDRSAIYYASSIDYENQYEFLINKYFKYYLPIFQPKTRSLVKSYLQSKLKVKNLSNKNSFYDKVWSNFPKDERIDLSEKRLKMQFPTDRKSRKLKSSLLDIIRVCQINKITLIGLKFPLSASYINALDTKNFGADELFESKGLSVKNMKSAFLEHPEYFADQDHLNYKGSEIFTKILFAQ